MTKNNQRCSESDSTDLSNASDKEEENVPEILHHDANRISWTFQTGRSSSQTTLSTTEGGSSSSSSLGWSDEYEGSTTKKVFEELKTMHRVLRGEEAIPPHYDAEEYELWMHHFPSISIFDSSETPVNSTYDLTAKLGNETKVLSVRNPTCTSYCVSLGNCNNDTSTKRNPRRKMTAMRHSEISPSKLLNQRGSNITRKQSSEESRFKSRNIFTVFNKTNSWDADKYLKIFSISSLINERKHSSKSLLNRQISKEYPESSLEFDSLPFIEVEEVPAEKKQLHQYIKRSVPSTRKNHCDRLVLPPISDHFRSISATPRQALKTFSALSVSSNILLERMKVSRKASNVYLETPMSGPRKRNNFFR